jgi:hypothetical protein
MHTAFDSRVDMLGCDVVAAVILIDGRKMILAIA